MLACCPGLPLPNKGPHKCFKPRTPRPPPSLNTPLAADVCHNFVSSKGVELQVKESVNTVETSDNHTCMLKSVSQNVLVQPHQGPHLF